MQAHKKYFYYYESQVNKYPLVLIKVDSLVHYHTARYGRDTMFILVSATTGTSVSCQSVVCNCSHFIERKSHLTLANNRKQAFLSVNIIYNATFIG